jgi:ribosome-associated heat shock protein Hsp15
VDYLKRTGIGFLKNDPVTLRCMSEKLRIDKYLWAIRLFKTRTLATKACDDGKVKWEGNSVKPSRTVTLGDRYDVRTPDRRWTIEVTGLLQNRMKYEEAVKNYTDHTSEEDLRMNERVTTTFYTGKRLSKTGRPTKKQRRDLKDYLGDEPDAME